MNFCLKLLPLVFLPLFVGIPNFNLQILYLFGLGESRRDFGIHLSVVTCLLGSIFFVFKSCDRTVLRFAGATVVWLTVTLIIGLQYDSSYANLLFFTQTVMPVFAMFFGYQLASNLDVLRRFIVISTWTTAIFIVTLWIIVLRGYGPTALFTDRMSVIHDLAHGIPQLKSYYPICVLVTFNLALASYLFGSPEGRKASFIATVLHLLFIPFCWSRAGLLGFVACGLFQYFLIMRLGSLGARGRTVVLTLTLCFFLPVVVTKIGTTIGARQDVMEFGNYSDTRRLELFVEGFERAMASPVFGEMFVPSAVKNDRDMDRTLRLFPAHNQYVDLLLRGGFVFLAIFLWFLFRAMIVAWQLCHLNTLHSDPIFVVIGVSSLAFLIAVALSANFQLYFVQLSTAAPSFVLIGVLFRTAHLASDGVQLGQQAGQTSEAEQLVHA